MRLCSYEELCIYLIYIAGNVPDFECSYEAVICSYCYGDWFILYTYFLMFRYKQKLSHCYICYTQVYITIHPFVMVEHCDTYLTGMIEFPAYTNLIKLIWGVNSSIEHS